MNKRKLIHIILWVAALVCFVMSYISHGRWIERGGHETDPGRSTWMIYGVIGVICIAIWFFTREKEEEISITRS